jgi:hypothetical protein
MMLYNQKPLFQWFREIGVDRTITNNGRFGDEAAIRCNP